MLIRSSDSVQLGLCTIPSIDKDLTATYVTYLWDKADSDFIVGHFSTSGLSETLEKPTLSITIKMDHLGS